MKTSKIKANLIALGVSLLFCMAILLSVFTQGCATTGLDKASDTRLDTDPVTITFKHFTPIEITLPPGVPDFTAKGPDMALPIDAYGCCWGVRYGLETNDGNDSYGFMVSGYEPIIYLVWEYLDGESRDWKVVDGECVFVTPEERDAYIMKVCDCFGVESEESEADEEASNESI